MFTYSDLEIALSPYWGAPAQPAPASTTAKLYLVGMRFNGADSDTEDRLLPGNDPKAPNPVVSIDLAALEGLNNWKTYGDTLRDAFFQGQIADAFKQARANSVTSILRVRLAIDPKATELQGVHWETMSDPDPARPLPLFMSEQIAFSRYLASQDFSDIRSRPRSGGINALIVLSNPTDLAARGFNPIDPATVLPGIRAALGDHTELVELTAPGSATIEKIVAGLHPGFDILYLICHGKTGRVFLEQDDGTLKGVDAAEFVQRIQDLPIRPRLIVLASCQSAGDPVEDPDAAQFAQALGPMLAEAGIPAVIGMRGTVTVDTAARFFAAFFAELSSDAGAGQIDRAMSLARLAVKTRRDYWMPALFMRLRSGMVWYVPGFSKQDELPWTSICTYIARGNFIPVLGPDLPAPIVGSSQDLARTLADTQGFPLAPWDSADLAKVAQFVYTKCNIEPLRQAVQDARMNVSRANFPDLVKQGLDGRPLLQQIVADSMKDPNNAYAILTAKDFGASLYIATTADSIIQIALKNASGADPVELFCDWRDERQIGPTPQLDPSRPAIFYAYGKSQAAFASTWVLTEDDYLDYVIRTSKFPWPPAVTAKIAQSVLLFLGFRIEDLGFRILLRMILQLESANLICSRDHLCVQVNPEENTLADAIRAKRYFEKCFTTDLKIDIYWGTAQEFLVDLNRELTRYKGANQFAARASASDT